MTNLFEYLNAALPNYGADWVATGLSMLGHYLLGSKNKFGFISLMSGCIAWIAFGIFVDSTAIIIGSSTYFILHMRGFWKWKKGE